MTNNFDDNRMHEIISLATGDVLIDQAFKSSLRNRVLVSARVPETHRGFALKPEFWFALAAAVVLGVIGYGLWLPTTLNFTA